MKIKIKLQLFLVLFSFLALNAQTSQLVLEESSGDLHVFKINMSSEISEGFALRFAQADTLVPFKVLRNNSDLWLINSIQKPVNGNVVSWERHSKELLLQFSQGIVSGGEPVYLHCRRHGSSQSRMTGQVSLHSLEIVGDSVRAAAASVAAIQLPNSTE